MIVLYYPTQCGHYAFIFVLICSHFVISGIFNVGDAYASPVVAVCFILSRLRYLRWRQL
jgi:hypothetical protein